MKRGSGGEEQDAFSNVFAGSSLDPIPLQRTHLFDEPVIAVIAVTESGTQSFVSSSWIAVGLSLPVPLPPGIVIQEARCEDGIFVAPCRDGVFILRGPSYDIFYTITLPFVPANLILCQEEDDTGVAEAYLFCSSLDSLLYFPIEHSMPTKIITHTNEKSFVTSAVKNGSSVYALYSCGLLMHIENSTMTKLSFLENNCKLLWADNSFTIYQRANFHLILLKFGNIVAVLPMANVCNAVLKKTFAFFLLDSITDASPMLSHFEHASMARLDSIFASNLADSRSVVGNECTHANKNFLLYRGGVYQFS